MTWWHVHSPTTSLLRYFDFYYCREHLRPSHLPSTIPSRHPIQQPRKSPTTSLLASPSVAPSPPPAPPPLPPTLASHPSTIPFGAHSRPPIHTSGLELPPHPTQPCRAHSRISSSTTMKRRHARSVSRSSTSTTKASARVLVATKCVLPRSYGHTLWPSEHRFPHPIYLC